jgi:hypothetical protein
MLRKSLQNVKMKSITQYPSRIHPASHFYFRAVSADFSDTEHFIKFNLIQNLIKIFNYLRCRRGGFHLPNKRVQTLGISFRIFFLTI